MRDLYVRITLWTLYRIVRILRRWRVPNSCKVIGVTGSCGKTQTKDLIAAVLSTRYPGVKNEGSFNTVWEAARILFSFDHRNKFYVQEVAAYSPGWLKAFVHVLRPDIGIVTNVGWDHYRAFRGPDGVAADKAALIEQLPENGIAVLNADDFRVRAMSERTNARVVTFGLHDDADLHASDVSSIWPDRLSFSVRYHDETARVNTRLLGEYQAHNVLAALATGLTMNVPFDQAIKAVEAVEPYLGRMEPVQIADDIWFVKDTWKAPYWGMDAFFEFVEKANARRKIIVLGDISDMPGTKKSKYRDLAHQAETSADHVIFIGSSWNINPIRKFAERNPHLQLFDDFHDAKIHLDAILKSGDSIFLKSNSRSHLERIVLSKHEELGCWKTYCKIKGSCDRCSHLRTG